MVKYNTQCKERIDSYAAREADLRKRDLDLIEMIKTEKLKHREVSTLLRDVVKQDYKVFSKYVSAHGEKQILRKQVLQSEFSPRSS